MTNGGSYPRDMVGYARMSLAATGRNCAAHKGLKNRDDGLDGWLKSKILRPQLRTLPDTPAFHAGWLLSGFAFPWF
jgi:hypothetical protein